MFVPERAKPAAIHLAHAGCGQPLPRETVEIRLPPAAGIADKAGRGLLIMGAERLPDFATHLERQLRNRRPEPGKNIGWIDCHFHDRILDDAGRQSAPASVRRSNPGAVGRAQENRQTVSAPNDTHVLRVAADGAVRVRRRFKRARGHDSGAVHLFEPTRQTRQRHGSDLRAA